jgi:Predicted Zn-dependent peptidases
MRPLAVFACAFLWISITLAGSPRPPLLFPTPAGAPKDLPPDPALVVGELPNGVRYALRANAEPRGRASLRLVVAAGSLHETEEQRGLAHFLEHMAFNGSAHYPPGTLIEYFQRLGMNFGGDTNAYTSFDRTVYMLELPDTKPATLAEGFRVLADFAGGLLLDPGEIERERGVVLSEKLARDSADYRAAVAGYRFFLAGTRLPERLPIGVESVLKEADRSRFADFYDTWYRPERFAVIAVGDLDPATAKQPLADAFGPLAARAPERATPAPGLPAREENGPAFGYHHEPDASATTVTIQVVRPPDLTPDGAAKRKRDIPFQIACAALNRRFAELAKTDDAPFVRASVGRKAFPGAHDGVGLDLVARPGQWAETLRVGENELRRALVHGFTDAEVEEAVANHLNRLEQAVKTDPTRRSDERTDELVDAFIEGVVPTTPQTDLEILGPTLRGLTSMLCDEVFRARWGKADGWRVGVFGNSDIGSPETARAAIAEVYAAARTVEVAPPAEHETKPWAYENFGPAGAVTSRRDIDDLGITEIVFANGARLNLKRTEFEAGTIALRARVGVGQLTEPADRPGLAFFAGAAFTAGGLGQHPEDELRRLLAGRNVGVGLQVAEDAIVLHGRTTPADLELQLQLLAATIIDPGYRPEAQLTARRRMEPFYARLATDPAGPLNLQVPKILASGDHRFGVPAREDAMSRTLDELREWLAPQLASGPLELSLVGDLDIGKAIAASAATIGALPPRGEKPALEELRRVQIAPPGEHVFTVDSTVTKTVLAWYWPTTDARDISRTRRLALLANIFSDRLRKTVREEIGGSYSPSAGSLPSETFRDYGFIAARITLDPAEAERVGAAVLAAAEDLAANGVTEDELDRARRPVLTSLRETERTNAYWLHAVLAAAQEQPWRLDWARSRYADHEAVAKAELDALAAAYLPPGRAIRFTINARPAGKP